MLTDNETIHAKSDFKFFIRYLIMAAVALGVCLWSIYDGNVKYPAQRVRALEYIRLEDEGRVADWPALAKERGWPEEPPGAPKTDGDIVMQHTMAVVTGLAALGLVAYVLMSRGSWIEATSTGLRSSSGKQVEYDQIVSLDKRKWKDKGLAYANYEVDGRAKRFVIDDFKFLREPTDRILDEVEARLLAAEPTGVDQAGAPTKQ